MRSVDADAILEKIDKEREYLIARGQIGAEHILVKYCRDFVEDAQTVEPERPRGEWIYNSDSNSITCSKCACTIWSSDIVDGNAYFCPNCGVKMGNKNETDN